MSSKVLIGLTIVLVAAELNLIRVCVSILWEDYQDRKAARLHKKASDDHRRVGYFEIED